MSGHKVAPLPGGSPGGSIRRRRGLPPPPRGKAIVFDLWNTLVPFPKDAAIAITEAMADALHVARNQFGAAWARSFSARALGLSTRDALCAIYPKINDRQPQRITRAAQLRDDMLSSLFYPRPAASEVLAALRRQGLRIGLLSDCGPESAALFRASALQQLVDAAVFSCEAGATKPDARLYREVAAALDVVPGAAFYVGDRTEELDGARSTGMIPIMLTGSTGTQGWAGLAIESLDHLPGLIARLHDAEELSGS